MHSPPDPASPETVSPRKRLPAPLTTDPMQTAGRSSLHGNSPDSVIPVHGPLMPERGSLPSSLLLYHARARRANGKHCPEGGKTTSDAFFSKVVKFAGQVSRTEKGETASVTLAACRTPDCSAEENVQTKKPHPEGKTRMRRETCFERLAPRPYRGEETEPIFSSAHFGMRNSGTGICMP